MGHICLDAYSAINWSFFGQVCIKFVKTSEMLPLKTTHVSWTIFRPESESGIGFNVGHDLGPPGGPGAKATVYHKFQFWSPKQT